MEQKRIKIFQSEKLNQQFEHKGYITIPFLNEKEVEDLKKLYEEKFPESVKGFYSTSFSTDETVKKEIEEKVNAVFQNKTKEIFNEYNPLGSCYLVKSPGTEGEMPLHQDWTMVDETKYDSITIWIPLINVNKENGAMQVVDGSHRFSDIIRSPFFKNPLNDIQEDLRNDLKFVSLKAGEAIVFSQALIHCSPPNLSNENRIAITYGLTPKEAQLYFYYKNKEGLTEKWEVPNEFFKKYNTQIGEKPNVGKMIAAFEMEEKIISKSEYQQMQKVYRVKKQKMYKMKKFFKSQEHQDFFEKEGYMILPVLSETEVEELRQYYKDLNIVDARGFGFHVSMDNVDKEISAKVREKIWGLALPKLDEYLENYKPFVASFVVKDPNPKGVVPAHQDWSFVDNEEEGYCSVTCWITLVDTNLDNGAMGVIKGSNNIMESYKRASPSPQTPIPLGEHMFTIFPYLKTLEMKAGEVLMFDNRTFHASPPNTTQEIRLAAGVGITQKDAELIHYYLNPNNPKKDTVLKYKIDTDFFIKYDNTRLSKMYDNKEVIEDYELIGEFPYDVPQLKSEDLVKRFKEDGNEFNVPMCEKLSLLFGYDMMGTKKEEPKEEVKVEEELVLVEEALTYQEPQKSFFETYTPYNIMREIKFRITGK